MTFDQEKFDQTFKTAGLNPPRKIRKRNGKYENFDPTKIYRAVELCYSELKRDTHPVSPQELTEQVSTALVASYKSAQRTVEVIQDLIELRLNMASDFEAARAFIVYREDHARRRIAEIPEKVKEAFAKDADFLKTPGQQFVFYDKYSRWNNDLNRRETWVETVDRTVDHLRWEVEEHLKSTDAEGIDEDVFKQIHEGILKTNVMPSMRLLAMAGPAVRRNSLSLYNCSYLPVRDTQAFVEALLISMNGCGVGFSVERENVERFPRIRRQRKNVEKAFHMIEDTTEGWAEALRLGLETWWDGRDIEFNFSLIRPAGSVLFTKGGRSSGPEPLRAMLSKLREIILSRQGSFLRTVDAHYMMCAVGDAAVQGGTRRTAMISLFSPDDYEMMTIKSGPVIDPLLWNANNSIVWGEDITDLEIVETMITMIKNKSGEPGIFSRRNAQATKPRRRAKAEFGTNPCVTSDTWVTTENGPRQVKDLVGIPFRAMVQGRAYDSTEEGFFATGTKEVYRLKTSDGRIVRLTADHKVKTENRGWVKACELTETDAIMLHDHGQLEWSGRGSEIEGYAIGHLIGDGFIGSDNIAHLCVYNAKDKPLTGVDQIQAKLFAFVDSLGHRTDWKGWVSPPPTGNQYRLKSKAFSEFVNSYGLSHGNKTITPEIERASSEFAIGFVRGLFDTDGHVEGIEGGSSIRFSNNDYELILAVQRILSRLGIKSRIYTDKSERKSGYLSNNTGYRLSITATDSAKFMERIGFWDTNKESKWYDSTSKMTRGFYKSKLSTTSLVSFEPDGMEEVYDCTVPGPHAFDGNGFVLHNCGEIILRPYGLCNLSQAVCRYGDDEAVLTEKVRLATIIGLIQSLSTRFPGMREEWAKNCIEERLLGVDLTAQHTCELTRPGAPDAEGLRDRLNKVAFETAEEYSKKLGINMPAAITTNKPAGNSSELLNVESGIHAAHAPFYIRRYTVGVTSPLFKVLKESGVPMEPRVGTTPENATAWIMSIPKKSSPGVLTKREMSAVEQLEFWKLNKVHWTEHNPSVTISYQMDEIVEMIEWVAANKDVVGGVSFLPVDDHVYAQAPYEEISEERYEKLSADFPKVAWETVYTFEMDDMTTAAQEMACFAGSCEV